ncbi:hypothetical protein [Streptomyces eurythermus]|uniref:hypothetical protein n=1 Tax=Streptomyces eurythermus TaxID=42237 RepID=UPI0036D3E2EF
MCPSRSSPTRALRSRAFGPDASTLNWGGRGDRIRLRGRCVRRPLRQCAGPPASRPGGTPASRRAPDRARSDSGLRERRDDAPPRRGRPPAAVAEGTTVISGSGELRARESDRIASTARLLRAFGVQVSKTKDGMVIEGAPGCARVGWTRMVTTASR